jgi:hypothetical protein
LAAAVPRLRDGELLAAGVLAAGVLAVPEVLPEVPLIAAGGVAVAVVPWVLNDSRKISPATVPTIARTARSMEGLSGQSEGERFEMYLPSPDPRVAQ